jgi:hypothetical protein
VASEVPLRKHRLYGEGLTFYIGTGIRFV